MCIVQYDVLWNSENTPASKVAKNLSLSINPYTIHCHKPSVESYKQQIKSAGKLKIKYVYLPFGG